MDDIEDRLRSHAQAFDGLLSLIPAKYYYGDDGSDQWQRKKQTKEEAREAKRAKLDPDSSKTAKDIMDENARKRKREEKDGAQSDDASEGPEDLGSEAPKEGLKRGDVKQKKQKQTEDASKSNEAAEARKKLREEKKEQKKANQKEKKKAKVEAKKATQSARKEEETETKPEAKTETKPSKQVSKAGASDDNDDDDDAENEATAEGFSLEFNPEQTENPSSVSSTPNSPGFDASNVHSGSSSISSIVPPTAPTDASKNSTSESKPLKATPEELKQRLQKRLDELRAARHADGFDGKPARNRQELIEARRQKAEERKEHKKVLRQKAKEELQRKNDEAIAKRFSPGGSGSLLASPRSPADSVGSNSNSYSFGRVMFADGQHTDPTLSNIRDERKRQVVQDPAAALKTAESKKARLDSLDAEKRAELEEKDMWLNAKKRAHGERVRDDTSLLKKALKRKESAKKKSEREWRERLDAVRKGKDMKQSKREENLRKRREGKGGGGDKKGKKKAAPRPGFEGSFKTKVGGKKK